LRPPDRENTPFQSEQADRLLECGSPAAPLADTGPYLAATRRPHTHMMIESYILELPSLFPPKHTWIDMWFSVESIDLEIDRQTLVPVKDGRRNLKPVARSRSRSVKSDRMFGTPHVGRPLPLAGFISSDAS